MRLFVRLGVSGKILLGLGVFLIAFAGYATFTVVSMHRARGDIRRYGALVDAKSAIEEARSFLNDVELKDSQAPDPRLALAFKNVGLRVAYVRRTLTDITGVGGYDDVLLKGHLINLTDHQRRIATLARELGTAQASGDPKLREDFNSRVKLMTDGLRTMAGALRDHTRLIASHLAGTEQRSLTLALVLGIGGLIAAAALALFVARTLRPLTALREHAREVAAGDYARRTGVRSHDEIGELAREFDAMATAIEERERRLIRSERLATVGRMAAQITHEIRNPLASIGLNAELLGDELPGTGAQGDEARRLVASISGEVDRLTEITETYLRFARLPRPRLEREDAAAIVTSAMEFSRAELSQAGIALELSVAAGLPDVAADEAQIRQALLNLVRNAREAMPSGGQLQVNVREVGSGATAHVRIKIHDSGPGIAPEHQAKVFDPFFSTKERGTGLGLALVHQIIAEHGGRIDVSSAEGQGTAFALSLPVLPPRAAVAAAAVDVSVASPRVAEGPGADASASAGSSANPEAGSARREPDA